MLSHNPTNTGTSEGGNKRYGLLREREWLWGMRSNEALGVVGLRGVLVLILPL